MEENLLEKYNTLGQEIWVIALFQLQSVDETLDVAFFPAIFCMENGVTIAATSWQCLGLDWNKVLSAKIMWCNNQ